MVRVKPLSVKQSLFILIWCLSILLTGAKKAGVASGVKSVNMGIPDESKIEEAKHDGKKVMSAKEARNKYKDFLAEE